MKNSGGLKWALGLSIVLNLFLIAAGLGAVCVIHNHMNAFHHQTPMGTLWHDATKDMTPQARQEIHDVIATAALSGEDDMSKAQALRQQAETLAATDPYDTAKINDVSAQARGFENDSRAKVETALLTGIATLPAAERAKVVNNLLRPSFRFHRFISDPKAVLMEPPGPPHDGAHSGPAAKP